MTAPLLEKLQVIFINQLTFHLPHLHQFLRTAKNLRFRSARLFFDDDWFSAIVYPNKEARMYALYVEVDCRHLDRQLASAAQIFSVLRSAFSPVESLTLEYWGYDMSSEQRNETNRTQWRDLIRLFNNVKTLRVDSVLVSQLSRSLQFEDGESPVELLPEVKELSYPDLREFDDAFITFIGGRRISGRPVTVVRF